MSVSNQILPPPTERYTILNWLRKNLFQNWLSSIVTLLSLYVIFIALRGILVWALTEGQWQVIITNMRLFMVGQYPIAQIDGGPQSARRRKIAGDGSGGDGHGCHPRDGCPA